MHTHDHLFFPKMGPIAGPKDPILINRPFGRNTGDLNETVFLCCHTQSATLCVFKNSPRAADVFVSVVCLFDTPMSRPQLADCSRSDHSSPTPAGATPLSNGTDLRPSSSPPSLPHLPIYAHPALYDSHRATAPLPKKKKNPQPNNVEWTYSFLLCHYVIC